MNKTPIDSSDDQVVHPHHHHKGSHRKHHHRHHRSHQNHEKKSDPTIEFPKEKEKELQSSATKLPVIVREESSDILNNEENDSTNQASPPENTIAISITDGEGAKAKDTKLGSSIARNGRRVSTTEERRNPFAQREGNSLVWNDVSMSLVSRHEKNMIFILAMILTFQLALHARRQNNARERYSTQYGEMFHRERSLQSWAHLELAKLHYSTFYPAAVVPMPTSRLNQTYA